MVLFEKSHSILHKVIRTYNVFEKKKDFVITILLKKDDNSALNN